MFQCTPSGKPWRVGSLYFVLHRKMLMSNFKASWLGIWIQSTPPQQKTTKNTESEEDLKRSLYYAYGDMASNVIMHVHINAIAWFSLIAMKSAHRMCHYLYF